MAKGWAAARLRLRSEVRTMRAGLALLVAVIGLSAGVTMAAAAGARRSDSAYGRFLTWSHNPEIGVSGCACTADEVDAVFARLRAAPFVRDSVRMSFVPISPELPDGTRASVIAFLPVIDIESRLGRELPRVKVLRGRLPNPSATDEAAIGLLTAERFHLAVGDRLRLLALGADGKPYVVETVRIAGVYAAPGELPSASGPEGNSFLLTAAFAHAFPELIDRTQDTVLLRLRPGATREEARAFIKALGVPLEVSDSADLDRGIDQTIRVETIALIVLAVVVGSVGLVVGGQMLRRHSVADEEEAVAYSALGAAGGDALRLGCLRGAVVGLLGAVLGVATAMAMSPLFPVGIGRVADPDPGLHADAPVLALGAALTLAVVTALGLLTARDALRRERRPLPEPDRLWPLPASRPPMLVGLYFALPRRAGQRSSPVRLSLVSLGVVVGVLAATAVTLASFDHLVGRRDLAGSTWQAAVEPPQDEPGGHLDLASSIATVRKVPGVDAATSNAWATPNLGPLPGIYVDGQLVAAQLFGDDGPIRPAITHGRAPSAPGEIALGSKTLAHLGVDVGDEVELSLDPKGPSLHGHVVGEVVLASPFSFDFAPGTGAATVTSTVTALGANGSDAANSILVRYKHDADPRRTFTDVQDALGTGDMFEAADRHSVSGLGRIRLVPILLLLGMLALVAAAVAHVLLVSVAGHRRDVAVLRAIGFTGPQSWASVTVHALVLALGACLIGIPAGVVLGRAAWDRIAASLFVVPRPMAPLELLTVICLVLVAVAIVASLVPAARAVRPKPAVVLRAD